MECVGIYIAVANTLFSESISPRKEENVTEVVT
jgi:hypothetical protein